MINIGLLFAFLAIISWGIGDFLIQRGARSLGNWETLFYITFFGALFITPFIIPDLINLVQNHLIWIVIGSLLFIGIIEIFGAILEFEALKKGKISVVEPIFTFEIVVTVLLSTFLLKEVLEFWQYILILILFLAILLTSIKSFHSLKQVRPEKGLMYAFLGAILIGTVDYLYGLGSRETSPLLVNWIINVFIAIISIIYILKNNEAKLIRDFKRRKALILGVSLFDNLARVSFSYATVYLPISIATGLTESYIVLAAILGIIINKEKLKKHQVVGLVITTIAAIALAATL